MSKLTEFQRVQRELELRIISGHYPENFPMPSIKDVQEEFNVSKSTVQIIYTAMKNDGTIFAERGKSTWVSPYCMIKLKKKHTDILRNEIFELKEYSDALGLDFSEQVALVLSDSAAE